MREGTVISDRYQMEQLLGRRGVNQVHQAIDVETNIPIAVKVSTPSTGYHEILKSFERAVQIGYELDRGSEGLVRPLDCGEFRDHAVFLVMDLVEGARDLNLTQGPLPERLQRLRQAAELVREVHGLNIVHRDVRPGNFLIAPSGRVHLSGFGMARQLTDAEGAQDAVSQTALALGQPHYFMAPELLEGHGLHPSMDIYSLGVMLFQTLTGELPYTGTLDDVILAQREVREGYQEPPSPREFEPSVPGYLDQLCQLALQIDPQLRLGAVDDLLSAYHDEEVVEAMAAAASAPAPEPAPEPAPPPQPPARQRPAPPASRRIEPPPHTDGFQSPPGAEEAYDEYLEQASAVDPYDEYEDEYAEPETPAPPPAPKKGDVIRDLLLEVRHTLPAIAGGVGLKGHEIKFVYFSAHELISGKVSLSFLMEDPRFAFFEQRVTLDRGALKGKPSGGVSLQMAANAVNLYAPGMRCIVGEDRLRFRREVLLKDRGVLTPEDLQLQIDLLLSGWPQVFAALRDVQDGQPWHEALGFLLKTHASDPNRVAFVEDLLRQAGTPVRRLPDDRLAVGASEDQAVVLACLDEEIHATQLIRSWTAPKKETKALKKGKHAPAVEALLEELNAKNREAFHTLAWDPKRGVVARAQVAEFEPTIDKLQGFLEILRNGTRGEQFTALGEGAGAKKKRGWLPWS